MDIMLSLADLIGGPLPTYSINYHLNSHSGLTEWWQWSGYDVGAGTKMLCPTEGRNGSGRDRRSVTHAIALRDLAGPRFIRTKGQFLCSQQGRKRFGILGQESGEITCEACLERVQRMGLSVAKGDAVARMLTVY